MPDPVDFPVGGGTWAVSVPDAKRVPLLAATPSAPPAGPRELVRIALAAPLGLNVPLRLALTPDDRVAVVLDSRLPHLNEVLAEVLGHVNLAGVPNDAVTVIVPPTDSQGWIDTLPDDLDDIHVEVHDPADPRRIAFLGPVPGGRDIYLNRTLVEAEFVLVLGGRRFAADGCDGAEAALFPALSNADTLAEVNTAAGWRAEAVQVAWRLGTPCFVQVIEGPGDTVAEVVAGIGKEGSAEGERRQRARWAVRATETADLVIAGVGGERVGPAGFAVAVANGRKLLAPDGRLVLLTGVPFDRIGEAFVWLAAEAEDAPRVFIASGWDAERVEALTATPLGSDRELARLIAAAERVAVLPDADKVRVG